MNARRTVNREMLEELYAKHNRRKFVHPDPLEVLYDHGDVHDREIVGLVASSLAYGSVAVILRSVRLVLSRLSSPALFLQDASLQSLRSTFAGFRHRFTTGEEMAAMLFGAKRVIERFGSLGACFAAGVSHTDDTVLPALSAFARELVVGSDGRHNSLLPSPARGSACKRLNLFLRWMVRRDAVDPGGWDSVPASKLIVPLDVHMHAISLGLGLTKRKQANMRTALEVTDAFRTVAPHDPVRYDFALTRLGIRNDTEWDAFLRRYKAAQRTRPWAPGESGRRESV